MNLPEFVLKCVKKKPSILQGNFRFQQLVNLPSEMILLKKQS